MYNGTALHIAIDNMCLMSHFLIKMIVSYVFVSLVI